MLPSHSPTQTLFWHNGKWGWSICCVCYLPLQVLGSYEFALSVFPAAWSSPCIVCLYLKKKTSSAAPRRGGTRYLGTREWGLSLSTPTGSSKPSNTEQGVWPCLSYSWTAGEDVTQPGMDKKKKERKREDTSHAHQQKQPQWPLCGLSRQNISECTLLKHA